MTDSSAPPGERPRPVILVALAVAVAALLVYNFWPAASRQGAPSNPPREQRKQAAATASDAPGSLAVRLDALQQQPPAPDAEAARNPFRFYVPPPPPPPPPPKAVVVPQPKPLGPGDEGYVPPGPPPPPPIPLKFFGTVERAGKKVAVFQTERPGIPIWAAEGEIVLGQYRVVKIGVESVTVEYLDGRGRQVIPMRGGGAGSG
jgi:hypothetical protein